ncbi:MAG: CHAD domain-containing protein [Burkholderiales bacterium]|nr:CHAD domain-containing protein [Burkholderiales bacterium]
MTTVRTDSETELKLLVPPGASRRLGAHPLLKGAGRPTTKKLYSVYLDTPDLDLCRQGVAFRLRKDGVRWVQAVKGGGEVKSGLHRRVELEAEVAGPAPDCSVIDSEAFSGLFSSPRLCAQLRPVFSTQFSRTSRIVSLTPDVTVEVCIDRGMIKCGDSIEPICELELELKSGAPRHLYELALQLLDSVPLRIENRSKAERGYALLRGESPAPVKAQAVALDTGMSVNDAFKAIVWASLNHLQANEHGMLDGRDPEYLHQMRVALRRMRSAFSTFSGALPQEEAALFVAEIKWLARALGPARDWDVFMTETLPPILRDFGGQAGLAELSKQGARARTAARRRAQNAIASVRYQRLNLMLPAWLVAEFRFNPGDEAGPDALRVPAPSFAGAALERSFARARKRGRKLRQLSAAELHLLRIAVKKLRYVADSFATLYDEKCIARMLARLARLQNILGAMNDAATVAGLMKRLGAKSGKDMSEARGIVLGWTKGRAEALKYEFYSAWKAFRDCEKCW